jgi:starvation-inducible outer membrane lipoprotein
MSFTTKAISLKTVVLFLAGCLTVPAAAQQEVSPEHFERTSKPAESHKPSPQARRASSAGTTQNAGKQAAPAAKAKKKILAASVVKTNAGAGSNSR